MKVSRAALAGLVAAVAAAAPAMASLPQIDYTLSGRAGDGDWWLGPVTVKWTLSGETSSNGCDTRTLSADTAGTELTCTASNGSGPISATTRPIRIDQVAPVAVTAAAARGPDVGSWFTSPVAIAWTGTDALSGIAACTAVVFAGPDDAAAAPAGTCRDRAGNVSPAVAFPLAYDATAPALAGVSAKREAGSATVRWQAGPDAARVTVVREPGDGGARTKTVADGPPGATKVVDRGLRTTTAYRWTVTVRDAAGNVAAVRTARVRHAASRGAATASRPPVLRWRAVRGAAYYNVQVLRAGRKILSAWPSGARYALRARWRFGGRAQRLAAGRYSWYVWPGYGPRAARRYGPLHAHGRFVVR